MPEAKVLKESSRLQRWHDLKIENWAIIGIEFRIFAQTQVSQLSPCRLCQFMALYWVNYLKYNPLERLPFGSIRPMHAKLVVHSLCHLLQSSLEIFGRDVVMINLSRPSAFSAWSLYSQRDFSGSGLASFDGRDKKDIVAESGKSENEIRGRKCWKNHHGHDLKNTYSQVTFFKAEVNAKVVKLRLS